MTTATPKPRVRLVAKKLEANGPDIATEQSSLTSKAPKKAKTPSVPKPVKEDTHAQLRVRAYELAFEHQLHPQLCFDILRIGGTVEQWKEQQAAQRIVTLAARKVKRKKYLKERKARQRQAYLETSPLENSWLRPHKETGLPLYFHTINGVHPGILQGLTSYQYVTRPNADTPPREARDCEKLECLSISAGPTNSVYQGVDAKLREKGLCPPKKIGLRLPFPQANLELAMTAGAEVKITLYDGSICMRLPRASWKVHRRWRRSIIPRPA